MSDLNYRAVLIDPGVINPERVVQTFANSPDSIDDWAQQLLTRAVSDEARVDVFTISEVLTRRIAKPKDIPRDEKGRCLECGGTGRVRSGEEDAVNGFTYCRCPTGTDIKRVEARGR